MTTQLENRAAELIEAARNELSTRGDLSNVLIMKRPNDEGTRLVLDAEAPRVVWPYMVGDLKRRHPDFELLAIVYVTWLKIGTVQHASMRVRQREEAIVAEVCDSIGDAAFCLQPFARDEQGAPIFQAAPRFFPANQWESPIGVLMREVPR